MPVREERMRAEEPRVRIPEEIGPIGPVDFGSDREVAHGGGEGPIDVLTPFDERAARAKAKAAEPTYVVSEYGRHAKPAAIGGRKGKHTRPREAKVHRQLGGMAEAEGETPSTPEATPRIATEGRIGMTDGIGPIDLDMPTHRTEDDA